MKALGYFREDDAPASKRARAAATGTHSFAEQSQAFLEFCRRDACEVGATFVDAAGDSDRSEFGQLLEYLQESGGSDCVVVVASLDRLGPELLEAARSLFQIIGLGARLVALEDGIDPTLALVQRWSQRGPVATTGERVREAMRRRAVRGEVLGRPPYGYGVGPRRRLDPVPEEASVVSYIFRLYTHEGLGIRLIARRLNEEGYRTRRDGNWSMITIRDILLNRAYLGTYTRFGVRVPGSHPSLVSAEDYRRVQERMASRRTSGGVRHVRQFLLSGLVYCGYCGNRMIGVSRRQAWTRRSDSSAREAEYRYYQCLTRTNQSMCDYHTRRADALEDEVRKHAAIAVTNALAQDNPAGAIAALPPDELRGRLREQMRQLDRQLEQYLIAAAATQISIERVQALGVEVAQQQLAVAGMLKDLNARDRVAASPDELRQAQQTRLTELCGDWDVLTFERRQSVIRDVVERVTVFDDASLVSPRI